MRLNTRSAYSYSIAGSVFYHESNRMTDRSFIIQRFHLIYNRHGYFSVRIKML